MWILYPAIVNIVCGIRIGTAIKDETIINRIANNSNPLVYGPYSKLQCGAECMSVGCFSIFYNTDTSRCIINTEYVDISNALTPESGWLFYEFKGIIQIIEQLL